MGNSNSSIFASLFASLSTSLIEKIKTLDEERLDSMLHEVIHHILQPEMRTIVFAVLERNKKIPDKYLEEIAKQPHILKELPINAKQQLWLKQPQQFRAAAENILDQFFAIKTLDVSADERSANLKVVFSEILNMISSPSEGLFLLFSKLVHGQLAKSENSGSDVCELMFDIVNGLSSKGHEKLVPLTRICRCMKKALQLKKVDQTTLESLQAVLSDLQEQPAKKESIPEKPPSLEEILQRFWGQITRSDVTNIFSEPVSREVPSYYQKIKKPMDLRTMRTKIQKGSYQTLDAFCTDVGLMWTNCLKFNEKGTIFAKEALRLQAECKQFRVEALQKLQPASSKKRKSSEISSTGGDRKVLQSRKQQLTPIQTGADFKNELISASMLLARPSFQSLLYMLASDCLYECQRKMMIPLQHPMLPSLLQLLQLTVVARIQTVASNQCTIGIPAPDQYILRVLCPTFMHFCVHKLPTFEKKDGDLTPDKRLDCCWADKIMANIMGQYAKKLNRIGDKATGARITSKIPKDLAARDPFFEELGKVKKIVTVSLAVSEKPLAGEGKEGKEIGSS